ncbi:UDP-glucose 4-epimerase GalE [Candidatus Saccharibacteria bacterium]|nr:UDP-glucose 4-epimerase GalE [Candidatus Saccharibacteria bacterium]
MKKILATGGTGYIGSHTAIELIKNGYEVELLDNLFNSKITVLDQIEKITGVRPKFYEADILDKDALDKIFAEGNYDAVIHFAGLKAVGESVEKPLWYYYNNITGTVNLMEVMKKYGVKEMVFSSSATVYGIQDTPECVETMQTGGQIANPYGKTKFFIEEIIKDYAVSDPTFKATILRYFNPIGAHESGLIGEDPNGIPNNLMPIIMRVSQGKIPELSVFGDDYNTEDGTARRDYIHVVDLAKGHVAAIEHIKDGVSIYNLGTGRPSSVLEMIAAFEKASGEKLPYKIVGRRAGDLPEIWANADKAKQELGWSTELTIDDAMRDTINYLNKVKE